MCLLGLPVAGVSKPAFFCRVHFTSGFFSGFRAVLFVWDLLRDGDNFKGVHNIHTFSDVIFFIVFVGKDGGGCVCLYLTFGDRSFEVIEVQVGTQRLDMSALFTTGGQHRV